MTKKINESIRVKYMTKVTLRFLKQFPSLKTRMPNMWTRSYYAESVGHISENTIKNYIEQQKNK